VYRLPTDAEWEYMARAGTSTAYPWEDTWSEGKANVGSSGVQDVGQYAPNGWERLRLGRQCLGLDRRLV
jgi:formylglycine-generating enzyme required for sulfatase activity